MTDGSLPRADDMLPPPDPGLVDRLIGTVLRRLIKGGPRPEELMEGLRASRMQSGHEQESDDVLPSTRLSPARTRRRPKSSATRTWPSACPGCSIRSGLAGRQRSGATSGAGTHSGCTPVLVEEDGAVVVRAYNERIGRLQPADAEVYSEHLRSARLNGQLALAVVRGSIADRQPSRVTANFMHRPTGADLSATGHSGARSRRPAGQRPEWCAEEPR
jgi:hypothetical protein